MTRYNKACSWLPSAIIALVLALHYSPAMKAFTLMLSTNTITEAEADSIHSNNVFAGIDGAWVHCAFNSFTNSTKWQTLIDDLNGTSWTVSEDVYWQNSTTQPLELYSTPSNWWNGTQCMWDKIIHTLGKGVHHAMVYKEPEFYPSLQSSSDTVLKLDGSFSQIYYSWLRVSGTPIVVHSRTYNASPNDGAAPGHWSWQGNY